MNRLKKHVCIHAEEVLRLLGLEGELRRVWVEQEEDYIHLILEWTSQRPAPMGFLHVMPHGHVEISDSFDESPGRVDFWRPDADEVGNG